MVGSFCGSAVCAYVIVVPPFYDGGLWPFSPSGDCRRVGRMLPCVHLSSPIFVHVLGNYVFFNR